jgi:hypothetical protein
MKAYKLKENKIYFTIDRPTLYPHGDIKKPHKIVFASEPLQAGKSELKQSRTTLLPSLINKNFKS